MSKEKNATVTNVTRVKHVEIAEFSDRTYGVLLDISKENVEVRLEHNEGPNLVFRYRGNEVLIRLSHETAIDVRNELN